ncbi:MAG TPA: hypothetical protein ENJ09_12825 [Planctomycetes bacterium]|nr:hypothetical protein [Planctomycetota bacterium]
MAPGVSLRVPGQANDAGAASGGVQVSAPTVEQLREAGDPPLGPRLHWDRLEPGGGLRGCLACGHPELYTQKDFPRPLGIAIVVLAALLAPFTSYISLAVAALLDAILMRVAPEVVLCYRCRAEHRGFDPTPRHPRFDRQIEERLLYGEKAVMGREMRPGGTADAPEPEH